MIGTGIRTRNVGPTIYTHASMPAVRPREGDDAEESVS